MKWPPWDHPACWAGLKYLPPPPPFFLKYHLPLTKVFPYLGQAMENLKRKAELWNMVVKLWGLLALSYEFGDGSRGLKTKQDTKIPALRSNPFPPWESISLCCKALHKCCTMTGCLYGVCLLSMLMGPLVVQRRLVNSQDTQQKNKFKVEVVTEGTVVSHH